MITSYFCWRCGIVRFDHDDHDALKHLQAHSYMIATDCVHCGELDCRVILSTRDELLDVILAEENDRWAC